MKYGKRWSWAAYGKHPATREFFRFGQDSPLMKCFSDWVENGYKTLISKKNANCEHTTWRFWTKTNQKNVIVCGLIKDSSDGLGRPYPFLIMGIGLLEDWENQWDLLPFACENTWNIMEYISSQMFNDLKQLEIEINKICPPHSEWRQFKTSREDSIQACKDSGQEESYTVFAEKFQDLKSRASNLSNRLESIVCLDKNPFDSQFMLISYWYFLLKRGFNTIPNALFMGGTIEKSYLAFFKRPLLSADFVQLWTVSSLEM